MPEALTITLEPCGNGVAVVHLAGRFDFASGPEVRAQLLNAVDAGHPKLIVEMGGVAFIDSAGIGALIGGLRAARQAGGDVRLSNPRPQARTLLSLTSIDQVLEMHSSVEAALAGFAWRLQHPPVDGPELVLDLQVAATQEGMDLVHTALAGGWAHLQDVRGLDERWRNEFALAVAEVAGNIIQYAHAPDPPLVEFGLFLTRHTRRLVASFIDRGIVATLPVDSLVDSRMPSVAIAYEDLGERGRGLALVQLTTDRFEYRRTPAGENIWILEKHFPV